MLAFPLLGEQLENTWNLKLAREFDVTQKDVSSLIHVNYKENLLPIYEGKMIWQFNHKFSEPKFWVRKDSFKKYMTGNKIDDNTVFDYENFRLVYRRLASSTNEHTLISTIIPPSPHADNLASVKSFNEQGKKLISTEEQIFLCVMFNSFVVDYCIRQRVTTNLNFFYIYQLPIPRLTESDARFKGIVERAAALICVSDEFEDLKRELVAKGYELKMDAPDILRAELDAMVAHLYDLTEDEFAHILKTFPIVKDEVKAAAMAEFRKLEELR
jgi:hypothetical protein